MNPKRTDLPHKKVQEVGHEEKSVNALYCLLFQLLYRKSMFAALPSMLNSHKSGLFHLTSKPIGLHHSPDGITNPNYKLLCFITTNFFLKREERTSF
jgi:hypothetical protein